MTVKTTALAALALAAAATFASAVEPGWTKIQLTDKFHAEGMAAADFNKDGKTDVVYGPFWYEGPDFKTRHQIFKPTGKQAEGSWKPDNEYSRDAFFCFTYDFNNDGFPDVLIYGFPGEGAKIYTNPGKDGLAKDAPWKVSQVFDVVDNESPQFADFDGDGKPDMIFHTSDPKIVPPRTREVTDAKTGKKSTKQDAMGALGYATADWYDPLRPWTFHPVSAPGGWQRFTHGYGFGDVNGDGKNDILINQAWFENPGTGGAAPWKEHKLSTGGGGAQIHVYDVDGDGLNDIITSNNAHGWGLAWYKQGPKDDKGEPTWTKNVIMPDNKDAPGVGGVRFSQLHAVDLVDMNGDGLKDIVTGKRYFAHGSTGDANPLDPAVLYWFELKRNADKSVEWVPHKVDDDSGVGTQVMATDVNGDGKPDILVGNKKGAFVFIQDPQKK